MTKYIKHFWNNYSIYIIGFLVVAISFILLGSLKSCSNNYKNKLYDESVEVTEFTINNHSYLRIYESDGFSTVRHIIHNPDCSCLK
jgi:hypothetical protein